MLASAVMCPTLIREVLNMIGVLEGNQIRSGIGPGGLKNRVATYAEPFGLRGELANRSNSVPATSEGADTTCVEFSRASG